MNIHIKNDIWEYLKNTEKPIALYGMGNGADKILRYFGEFGIKICGVFASDEFVRDKKFHGFKIKTYRQLLTEYPEMIVVVAFGTQLDSVIENIKSIAENSELYAVDVPVVGNTLFDLKYFEKNRKKFQKLFDRLADEQSRQTLRDIILFKLTGKIDYLFDCETEPNETLKFLKFTESEMFFDLGAYRGDTVAEFLKNTDGYSHIVAVEPDKKSYNKLVLNTNNLIDITNINACVGEECRKTEFTMSGGRNSKIGSGEVIEMVTVDCLSETHCPTFIKMDLEGGEVNAIKGADGTISKHKPKMQIACYHRTEDLSEIPEKVLEKRPDYKIYLRHFKYIPAWDVNYYFI